MLRSADYPQSPDVCTHIYLQQREVCFCCCIVLSMAHLQQLRSDLCRSASHTTTANTCPVLLKPKQLIRVSGITTGAGLNTLIPEQPYIRVTASSRRRSHNTEDVLTLRSSEIRMSLFLHQIWRNVSAMDALQ